MAAAVPIVPYAAKTRPACPNAKKGPKPGAEGRGAVTRPRPAVLLQSKKRLEHQALRWLRRGGRVSTCLGRGARNKEEVMPISTCAASHTRHCIDRPSLYAFGLRAEARFVGVPPHAFTAVPSITSSPSRSQGWASVGPMPARRSAARAASAGSHTIFPPYAFYKPRLISDECL